MKTDKPNYNWQNVDRTVDELTSKDGPTPYLYANIMHRWSKEKREAFARRLLGDGA